MQKSLHLKLCKDLVIRVSFILCAIQDGNPYVYQTACTKKTEMELREIFYCVVMSMVTITITIWLWVVERRMILFSFTHW